MILELKKFVVSMEELLGLFFDDLSEFSGFNNFCGGLSFCNKSEDLVFKHEIIPHTSDLVEVDGRFVNFAVPEDMVFAGVASFLKNVLVSLNGLWMGELGVGELMEKDQCFM